MPIPTRVGRFNRALPNRLIVHVAPFVPGFGVVTHRGRTSGRAYRTPVAVFRRGDEVAIALVYGPGADWVRNVLAAGGATVTTRRRSIDLTAVHQVHDPGRRRAPRLIRPLLGALRIDDFVIGEVASER
ncbi:nitroreductase family deazaflavin-dependent oxidoreductase [Mumia sp. Pv 4-285]|uniref:nitroreductase family deazaflavin-dependent oxidoreductase n=1 Tax=Mumia qirimensis TaxID=3234852 RepID=UPI00351CD036